MRRASGCCAGAVRACALADTGVLIPGDRQQPDPAIFSLNEMAIEIRIDNGMARVRVRQISATTAPRFRKASTNSRCPARRTVSDFAVWDDVTRIPGVILERRRAGEIYEQAKAQAIDPGLLQMGERDCRRGGAPQPGVHRAHRAHSGVRHQADRDGVSASGGGGAVSIRIRGSAQARCLRRADRRTSHDPFELRSAHAIQDFEAIAKTYPLQIRERTPNLVSAEFSGSNVELKEDFAVRYSLDPAEADTLRVITERESAAGPGFFQAQALLRIPRQPRGRQSVRSPPAR